MGDFNVHFSLVQVTKSSWVNKRPKNRKNKHYLQVPERITDRYPLPISKPTW